MPRNTSDTSRARAFGAELRRLRLARRPDDSLRAVAKEIGFSASKLSKAENGHSPPTPTETATMLGIFGVVGDAQEYYLDMARTAHDPTWVAPGQGKQLAALIDFEQSASRIVNVQPLLIPGLLQEPGYAGAIMRDGSMSAGQIQDAVNTRMGRQRVLTRQAPDPVELVALIGVGALRRPIGGHQVMAKQLRHIQKVSELPNVRVQAVPESEAFDCSLAGPFTLMEFSVAEPIVHFEHHRSSMFLPDQKDIEDMRVAAEMLREQAMSPESTSGLIAELINSMQRSTDESTPLAQV